MTYKTQIIDHFQSVFSKQPEVMVRAPGRAEIIGNHTDYNSGYALAAAIEQAVYAGFSKRMDRIFEIASTHFPEDRVTFTIDELLEPKNQKPSAGFGKYVRAVVHELLRADVPLSGASISVLSTVPSSGGVSSSAAFELAIQTGLSALHGVSFSKLDAALLCKRAENGPFVESPCGLLDQAAVALSENQSLLFLDFLPTKNADCTCQLVSLPESADEYCFIITVDPEVKRNLGDSGYPARRKSCEASLPIVSDLLKRTVESLRYVSIEDFKLVAEQLTRKGGDTMRKRVEHIVYENQRVLDAVAALGRGDMRAFGALLNASGESALLLYELDEKTPELTKLVSILRSFPETVGARNMGGGFSANCLALIKKKDQKQFEKHVSKGYSEAFGREPIFVVFQPSAGVAVVR